MGEAQNAGQPRVIIVDRPNSPQSLILAGLIGPAGTVENSEVYSAMNDAIGGSFTARVNMNLREDKGWSYGAQTLLWGARGQRPWIVYAPVQTDRTADSLSELLREFTEFTSTNPATAAELERSVNNSTRSLPGQFETAAAVRGSLVSSFNYGRDWNYPATLTERYHSLELGPIHEAAREVVNTDNLIWLIVGDAAQIEQSIRDLDMGEIEIRRLGQ